MIVLGFAALIFGAALITLSIYILFERAEGSYGIYLVGWMALSSIFDLLGVILSAWSVGWGFGGGFNARSFFLIISGIYVLGMLFFIVDQRAFVLFLRVFTQLVFITWNIAAILEREIWIIPMGITILYN